MPQWESDLDPVIVSGTGLKLYLCQGEYLTKKQKEEMQIVTNRMTPTEPLHSPGDKLWWSNRSLEVEVIGITEGALNRLIYQVRIVNNPDTAIKDVPESQLKLLSEAETVPEISEAGKLKVNRSTWAAIKKVMTEFLSSYPIETKEQRQSLEHEIKRPAGYAKSVHDERATPFLSSEDFTKRMSDRIGGFPWSALAELFDYTS